MSKQKDMNELREDMKINEHEAREEAREEQSHNLKMENDVDYQQDFINTNSGIRKSLKAVSMLCKMYDLNFDEIIYCYKDEL